MGLAGWGLLCLVAVALRGVRWDETYEHALLITGRVPMPAQHPYYLYVRNVFSLQGYLAAALLVLWDSPVFINGLRNVLFLCFTVVPLFLLTAGLTGRTLWGHVAAAFTLLGVLVDFQSYYPINVWPAIWSIGHVGAGYALLVLACWVLGRRGSAAFLLGLMAAIHIGQMPALVILFAGAGVVLAIQRRYTELRALLVWFGLGLGLCALSWVIQQPFHVPLPPPDADAWAIWADFVTHTDVHRAYPRYNPFGHTHVGLIAMLLLTGGAAYHEHRERCRNRPLTWLFAYAAVVAGLVWGIWTAQQVLGERIPFALIAWMPYRLANHVPALLLATALTVLVSASVEQGVRTNPRAASVGPLLVLGTLALAAAIPLWRNLLPDVVYVRYIATTEHFLFVLIGGAVATLGLILWRFGGFGRVWCLTCLVSLGALACYRQFGAACAAGGAAVILAPALIRRAKSVSVSARGVSFAAAGLGALVVGELLYGQWQDRSHLPISPFQRAVTDYLRDRGQPQALLLTPFWEIEWPHRTRHPVVADYSTQSLLTYMPALAPAISKMHEDLFGFDLRSRPIYDLACWEERSPEAWQALAARYGFRYVVCPTAYSLNLPVLLQREEKVLYALPAATQTSGFWLPTTAFSQ